LLVTYNCEVLMEKKSSNSFAISAGNTAIWALARLKIATAGNMQLFTLGIIALRCTMIQRKGIEPAIEDQDPMDRKDVIYHAQTFGPRQTKTGNIIPHVASLAVVNTGYRR
jgi:hypothetical protein